MAGWLGPLISAGASLAGGLINKKSAESANAAQQAIAAKNFEMQEQFAKKGIRWKVNDARKAGIHPLYALGAQTTSFSPVSVGSSVDTSFGSAVASMGQDLSRAINATRTAPERLDAYAKTVQDLSLTKMGLENELLASQVAKLKASINPPMPDIIPEGKSDERPPILVDGDKWNTNPRTSNAEDIEKRYGDDVFSPGFLVTGWSDLKHNLRNMKFFDILRSIDRATRIW